MRRKCANAFLQARAGECVIKVTPKALETWEQGVKTVGHEIGHIRDAKAGLKTLSESAAEEYAEAFWQRFLRGRPR